MKKKFTLYVTHNKDADGVMGLFLSHLYQKIKRNKNYDISGYNYENKAEEKLAWLDVDNFITDERLSKVTDIVFIDCTPPIKWLLELYNKFKTDIQVTIYDHHLAKIKEIYSYKFKNLRIYFDNKMCGSDLFFLENFEVFKKYKHNQELIWLLYCVGSYDTWSFYDFNDIKNNIGDIEKSTNIKKYYAKILFINNLFMEIINDNKYVEFYFQPGIGNDYHKKLFETIEKSIIKKYIEIDYQSSFEEDFINTNKSDSFQLAIDKAFIDFQQNIDNCYKEILNSKTISSSLAALNIITGDVEIKDIDIKYIKNTYPSFYFQLAVVYMYLADELNIETIFLFHKDTTINNFSVRTYFNGVFNNDENIFKFTALKFAKCVGIEGEFGGHEHACGVKIKEELYDKMFN